MDDSVQAVSTMTPSESSQPPTGPLWDFPEPAHADEDPASIIVRVAEGHFFRTSDLFSRYFQLPAYRLADVGNHPGILDQLDVLAGCGSEFLRSLGWQRQAGKKVVFRGQALPSDWIGEGRRVAPGVLAADGDQPYIRLAWRFPAIPFDLNTNEMLIDRCPLCFNFLTWTRIRSVCHCQNCQFDLREARPVYARGEYVQPALKLAAHLGLLPGEKIALPPPFATEDSVVALKVLEWCAWFAGRCEVVPVAQSATNAHRGVAVAERWPATLELAADLVLRQVLKKEHAMSTLQGAFRSLPNMEMRKGVSTQLAEIMQRLNVQRVQDYLVVNRWKYFQRGWL
ncbi:hypothetical protein JHC09_00555 [Devosia sp. MC532]|uniref:TniQ family protein n=1 Tax=Devosia sp. MC532 TaxID=2799788 RepID=UPI0018F4B9F4|nr:hypothetical protein [Devosia sp. MC532]MBJ7576375.1 hypothetical protein [Devosia sp. MC532]